MNAITCPACKKENSDDNGAACVRCGCDLSRLRDIRIASENDLSNARNALKNCDWQAAADHAEGAWARLNSYDVAGTGFLAAIGAGNRRLISVWLGRLTVDRPQNRPI